MLSTFALTSTFVALAASAPLAKRFVQAPEYVFGDSYLSNATFGNFIAKEYAIKENSCNVTNFDTDYVVSVKTNHTKLDEVCNMQVNVTNKDNGKWVLATIVDECVTCSYNYLLLSPAAYEKVASSSDSNFTATYTFSNYQAPDTSSTSGQGQAPAPQKQSSSSSSSAKQQASSTSAAPAKQSDNSNDDSDYKPSTSSSSFSSKQYQAAQDDQSSTSTSQKATTTKQEQDDKPDSTSTSSSKYYAPATTSTSWTPEPTTSSTKWVQTAKPQPTTTSTKQQQTYAPEPTTTQQQQQQQPQSNNSGGGGGQFSGRATYFYQGGNPGSCGNYNSDSAYIVAVNDAQMNSGLCGRSVRITNTANGQSITASVADTCPGCGYGSLDLSVGAFQGLGSMDAGVLPISWSFA